MAGSATKRREKMKGGVAKRTLYSSHCFLLYTFSHFRWILLSLISGLVNHQNYILINLEPLDSRLFVCHSKLWWCQHQDYSACERQSLICNHKCWCKWYYRWWCWCKLRWDVKVWNAVSRPNEAAGCIILPTPQTKKTVNASKRFWLLCVFLPYQDCYSHTQALSVSRAIAWILESNYMQN